MVTPILPTWQGICCFNTPGTPALLTDLGLIGLLLIVGYISVQRRRLPLGPNGRRVYKKMSRRSRVLRGVLPILVLVGCGDLGWLIAGILT